MVRRDKERPRCMSCGRYYRSKCRNCNSHHTQPTSRGGIDGRTNEVERDREFEHSPWHNLNSNLRVKEVARLIVFDWDTFCPHNEKLEDDVDAGRLSKRIQSWNTLYGKNATIRSVMEVIIKKFVRLDKDRALIREVLQEGVLCKKLSRKNCSYLVRILEKKIEE